MKDINFGIILFQLSRNFEMCEFALILLSITIGQSERCLFSYWKDYHKIEIDILFFHFKF